MFHLKRNVMQKVIIRRLLLMKFALSQMNIIWENKVENRHICERLVLEARQQNCDWIIFPEMTLTGFTMQPEKFSPNTDLTYFKSLSVKYSIGIVFGYIGEINGTYLNKMAILSSNGELLMDYAKIHPFSYGEESKHYIGGNDIITVSSDFADFSGFICYDLRFPEIFQIASKQATIIYVIANWPEPRISHWHTLLQARAIENQCFILGVNRTGDGGGLHYIPSSVAFDPYGVKLTEPDTDNELLYTTINPELALRYRREFPLKADRRESLY